MAKFAHRHSDGIDQFNEVMGTMRSAPNLVELGKHARGEDRFTTREMIEAEQRLHRVAKLMADRERHEVRDRDREVALARAEARSLVLSDEQADALAHVTDGRDLGIVVGHAGTGKSAMLGVAREAWEAASYEVRGVALSGIAAENLESGSGIVSRTIASMEHGWQQGRGLLTACDVLVIDEAGMVGTRQLERVLSHAAEAGAKVVLVGDIKQLQAIEAGAAFRSIHERHGGAEIGEVRRQREDWQRDATRDLAMGRTGDALEAYRSHGMVHEAQTRERARGDLIEGWDRDRQASPDRSRIVLTHTNDEVRALNEAARERMRAAGDLGDEVGVAVERGARNFASGDRVMFLQNERGLGVKNGTLGTVEQVGAQTMTVQIDDGRSVRFDLKDYNRIDHGYAATIHRAQGMTVGRTHVLATPGMDAHAAMWPCRGTATAWTCITAATILSVRTGLSAPCRAIGRRTWPRITSSAIRRKAMPSGVGSPSASAWPRSCAGSCRRSCATCSTAFALLEMCPARIVDGGQSGKRRKEKGAVREPSGAKPKRRKGRWRKTRKRNCAGCAPERSCAMPALWMRSSRRRRWAARQSPEQVKELQKARRVFEELRPYGSHDAEAAYKKNPELASEAAGGRVNRLVRALQLETELRVDLSRCADRFVERWQELDQTSLRQYRAADISGYRATRSAMGDMARSLERDPQLESILDNRKRELGIAFESGRRLGLKLAFSHGIDLGRGRGIEI